MCFRKEKHVCWASLLFFLNCFEFHCIFFFWSSSIENAVFLLFFKQKSVFSTFSSTTASFIILLTPFFFAFMCETSSVKDRYRCMSQVFTQYILCEKKKKKRMDQLFGNIWYTCAACAYFVTVLKVECWEWLSITREQKREKMQKKKRRSC